MNPYFYETLQKLYAEIDNYLPEHKVNPCGNCRICCTFIVRMGVSLLEYDYMKEYIKKTGGNQKQLDDFKDYLARKEDPKTGELLYKICPFYDEKMKGCSLYPARPLACRTFGYFIKENSLDLIPDECNLKKDVKIYRDETFSEVMPFLRAFYTLVFKYDSMFGEKGEE